ncbi:hypothetical protein QAD02_013935 [Eretmocerus hayati]|uniref:Uncharacterized protein n=1 Tax=Eretmocerus hayati TaxID=131215 RepID=A0ACC2P4Z1_9HYME|nr:hypothetical protein QAD02_013935 [Eretmocerus hayati]
MKFFIIKGDEREEVELVAVYCHDLSGLIEFVKNHRSVTGVLLKCGIDGVRGSMKVCLSIQNSYSDLDQPDIKKFKQECISKRFSDSSVKELFIIVESCQGNYENISKLCSLIGSKKNPGKYAGDLKVANMGFGIGPHSSAFLRTWCFAPKECLSQTGFESRTIAKIRAYCEEWNDHGANRKLCKNYKNCINEPIFPGDPEKRLIDSILPPQLHFFLGGMNTIYDNMLKENEVVTLEWAQSCHVNCIVVNGGSGFNGDDCKKLLYAVDTLGCKEMYLCPEICKSFEKIQACCRILFWC